MASYSLLPSASVWFSNTVVSTALAFVVASLFVYLALQLPRYWNPLRKLPYPPGPPPRNFLLGNARDLLVEPLWLTLADLAATYGPVMHLRALDQHLIVLSSIDDAVELMEKRSNNYSDRPYIPMLDLIGATFQTPFKPYGPVWHAHRRIFQQLFRPSASFEYRPLQVEKINEMLYNLLDDPEAFMTHLKTLSVSIIMSTMYGYKALPKNDPFQELADEAISTMAMLAYPGATIVNVLPFLRFLPSWFPGTDFHRVARVTSELVSRFKEVPFKYVQDNLAAGIASPSFVASLLETCKTEEDFALLKDVAGTGYAGGADTAASSISTFFYAMAKYPNVQKKAQEELDRVVGTDRLANYDDEASLPYIQAIYREVLRWQPAAPLAMFHAAAADDVYKGYYIPKGATLVPNVWAMSRDPLKYKDPDNFNPDRFLDKNNELNDDDVAYAFGFGRRLCPGRHMAAATVWLSIATILSVFDIRPLKDALGNDILLHVEYTAGIISHPHPFKCVITPRSPKAKQLVMDIRNGSI